MYMGVFLDNVTEEKWFVKRKVFKEHLKEVTGSMTDRNSGKLIFHR